SFTPRDGLRGQLRAKTYGFKGKLDDRGLVLSSLAGNLRFAGREARGTVVMHDMRVSSNGTSSTTPLVKVDGAFSFPAEKGTAGQLRATTGPWTADIGNSRIEGTTSTSNLLFSSDRVLGSLQATDIKASSLGSCPFAEMKSASLSGHLQTPENAPADAALRGSFDGMSL